MDFYSLAGTLVKCRVKTEASLRIVVFKKMLPDGAVSSVPPSEWPRVPPARLQPWRRCMRVLAASVATVVSVLWALTGGSEEGPQNLL